MQGRQWLSGAFMFIDRHVPAVRRHGYLLATVVTKPEHGQ